MSFLDKSNDLTKGIVGLLAAMLAVWIFSQSELTTLLRADAELSSIEASAYDAFESSRFASYEMEHSASYSVSRSLTEFVQLELDYGTWEEQSSIGELAFEWRGKTEVDGESRDISATWYYNLQGEQTGFSTSPLTSSTEVELTNESALLTARQYLGDQQVDTTQVQLKNTQSNTDEGVQVFVFTFQQPLSLSESLVVNYTLGVQTDNVFEYRKEMILDDEKYDSDDESVLTIVVVVFLAILWFVYSIMVLIQLAKKLRRDEIDFKRARLVGVLIGSTMLVSFIVGNWGDWLTMTLGGMTASLFVGLGAAILFAVCEVTAREVNPEYLSLTDALLDGQLAVRELGQAIMTALLVGGLVTLVYALVVYTNGTGDLGYFRIDQDYVWIFHNPIKMWEVLPLSLVSAFYIWGMLMAFAGLRMHKRVRQPLMRSLLHGAVILLAIVTLRMPYPAYVGLLFFFPVVVVLSYFVIRNNYVTTFLATFVTIIMLKLLQVAFLPSFASTSVIVALTLFVAALAYGAFLLKKGTPLAEFAAYVPEYISRIAERERIKRELEIARNIQFEFLPKKNPSFSGLDIASICKPAMEVGGDYYDFIHIDDRRLGVIVGDVSGKGVSAAFYMTMTKGIIKTLARQTAKPSKILSGINEVFYENAPRNIFISVLYGIFDMEKRVLTFARAGHNPLLVRRRKSQQPELLNPNGIAIGMDGGAVFSTVIEEASIEIEKDDIFVFYTDGLSEAMNPSNEEFGDDRLSDTLSNEPGETAANVLDHISSEIFTFSGKAPQHDDFTMVVVKITD